MTEPQLEAAVEAGLDELVAHAREAEPELTTLTNHYAGMPGGNPVFPGLKTRDKARSKIEQDYGYDVCSLLDMLRASIVFELGDQLREALSRMKADLGAAIVREKDRCKSPPDTGYRDILLNIRLANGHIAELQLHVMEMQEAKENGGHDLYDEQGRITAEAMAADKGKGRPLTPAERKAFDALTAQMREVYDAAYADIQSKKA